MSSISLVKPGTFRNQLSRSSTLWLKSFARPPCATKSASASPCDWRRISHVRLCVAQSARAHGLLQYVAASQRPQYRSLLPGVGRDMHFQQIIVRAGDVSTAEARSASGSRSSASASRRSRGIESIVTLRNRLCRGACNPRPRPLAGSDLACLRGRSVHLSRLKARGTLRASRSASVLEDATLYLNKKGDSQKKNTGQTK